MKFILNPIKSFVHAWANTARKPFVWMNWRLDSYENVAWKWKPRAFCSEMWWCPKSGLLHAQAFEYPAKTSLSDFFYVAMISSLQMTRETIWGSYVFDPFLKKHNRSSIPNYALSIVCFFLSFDEIKMLVNKNR